MDKKKTKRSLFANEIGLNTAPDRQIYIRDHLTTFKMKLFQEAKKIKYNLEFKYLWVKNSRIFLRQQADSVVYSIQSRNDINKIIAAFSNQINNDNIKSPLYSNKIYTDITQSRRNSTGSLISSS